MSKRYRITHRKDIQRLFDAGHHAGDGTLTLLAVANGKDHSRLAVGVSKRHGNAVRRNRIRRLSREAFRLLRPELPAGLDYIIIPRAGAPFTLESIQGALRKLATRVAAGIADEGGAS